MDFDEVPSQHTSGDHNGASKNQTSCADKKTSPVNDILDRRDKRWAILLLKSKIALDAGL